MRGMMPEQIVCPATMVTGCPNILEPANEEPSADMTHEFFSSSRALVQRSKLRLHPSGMHHTKRSTGFLCCCHHTLRIRQVHCNRNLDQRMFAMVQCGQCSLGVDFTGICQNNNINFFIVEGIIERGSPLAIAITGCEFCGGLGAATDQRVQTPVRPLLSIRMHGSHHPVTDNANIHANLAQSTRYNGSSPAAIRSILSATHCAR